MRKIDLGFNIELEILEGEKHNSYELRNNEVRRAIKLGEVKK
jgi:hypothetical protein